jgi:putative transposase
VLQAAGVGISMDGREGGWTASSSIASGASLKYECIYLHAFETGSEVRAGVRRRVDYYNAIRPHSALGGRTPNEAYAAPVGYQAAA